MEVYRSGIKICVLLCVSSLTVMVCCVFDVPSRIVFLNNFIKSSSGLGDISYDIALGVFASALVVLIINFVSYMIEKKKTIGLIQYYCGKYVSGLAELAPKLLKYENDKCKYDVGEIKEIIRSDERVFLLLNSLLAIYSERLLTIDGFSPVFRKNKKNLKYPHLICRLAKLNGAVQYCHYVYKVKNNPVYAAEEKDFKISESEFTKQIEILLQLPGDKEYEKFLDLLTETYKTDPSATVL